ncbi:cysteine-rich receptor-like protein kinase 10 [Miscanthus floridulus]|uniref:cysteine-rich receptor-like protein kinase 10 n=1 Tax=Miscanthus floridulus TaxID=154761 RepID=UPI00345840AE
MLSTMAIVLLALLLFPFADAQWQVCGNTGKYTAASTYQANLGQLSASLPKKASSNTTLFATDTAGAVPDMVYALALCRGDINASDCQDCVTTGFQDAQQLCAFSKEATVFYDSCLLSFSNGNFLSTTTNGGNMALLLMNSQNFTESADFIRLFLFTLLNDTAESAVNSSRRFMTARMDISSMPTMYCAVQCTPDLTADECAACLQDFPELTLQYLDGRRGGRVLRVRCNMRYEIYPFYQGDPTLRIISLAPSVPAIGNTTPGTNVTVYPQPPLPPPAAPPAAIIPSVPAQEQRGPKSKLWIIGIAIPLLAILLCSTFTFLWMRRRKKGMLSSQNRAGANRIEENALVWRIEEKSSEFTLFDLSELLEATENFAEENRLGQGGFGPVYKGQLSDGQEIAVKRLASHSGQGFTEFRNEVELIAKLQHTNLVRLLGCCIQGEEKILVYEYLPNKSLDFFIFDESQSSLLNWYKRRAIIEGVAQGLLYLHKHSRLRVVHRDLKASNILLDQDMNPKISDFGLARIFSSNDTEGSTKRVVGTYGYMSPEYASEGIYSVKSDVFSFGVLLLEILSAKRNSGFHRYGEFLNLLGYTWHLWEEGRWLDLVEASISKEMHEAEARRYINIALMCVQENADDRPTMSDVVAALNSESVVLPEPKHPAYFNLRVSKSVESAIVVETCSLNDVTITQDPQGR